jgi:hypothetical protein
MTTHLLPFLIDRNQIFQQDNASIHTSRMVKDWFLANNVTVMDWPALSPDLSPIENIWGIMVQRVYACGRQYDCVQHLKVAIQHAWDSLTLEELQKLVNSMPKRCVEVLKAQGRYISY